MVMANGIHGNFCRPALDPWRTSSTAKAAGVRSGVLAVEFRKMNNIKIK